MEAQTKTYYRYVRETVKCPKCHKAIPNNQGLNLKVPVGCIAFVVDERSKKISIGFSYCHKRDTFVKKKARMIAEERAKAERHTISGFPNNASVWYITCQRWHTKIDKFKLIMDGMIERIINHEKEMSNAE